MRCHLQSTLSPCSCRGLERRNRAGWKQRSVLSEALHSAESRNQGWQGVPMRQQKLSRTGPWRCSLTSWGTCTISSHSEPQFPIGKGDLVVCSCTSLGLL